jgi:hypothetical protein
MIKRGNLIKRDGQIKVQGIFSKSWPRKFCSETFYNSYENLLQMPKPREIESFKKSLRYKNYHVSCRENIISTLITISSMVPMQVATMLTLTLVRVSDFDIGGDSFW